MRAAILALTVAASCASSGAGTGAPAGELKVRPPRMISRLRPPQLRVTSIPVSGRAAIRVRFEVLIDTDGRPVMTTFKVSGTGAAENRETLAQWIESSTFAPATQGGIPVEGVYQGRLEMRTSRRPY
jgi:hypothetical protein